MDLIVTTDGAQLVQVHERTWCQGHYATGTRSVVDDDLADPGYRCCVHAPSAHPLRAAPLRWSDGQRVMYRLCVHDVLHPDPDDLRVRFGFYPREHPCDGCCRQVAG